METLRKKLKNYLTCAPRAWPWAAVSRNLLLVGLTACAVCAIPAIGNGPIPDREELTAVTGIYRSLEREEGYRLNVSTAEGFVEQFRISSYTTFDQSAFLDTVTPGEEISLACTNGTYRFVMELSAEGETFISYDRARQEEWNNNYLALIIAAVLTVVAQGGCALWFCLRKRPAAPEPAPISAPVPPVYSAEERQAVGAYINGAFGTSERVYYDTTGGGVDIALIPPSGTEKFYRLVTVGMGARRMEVPQDRRETNLAFAELVVFLPPTWDPDTGDQEPFRWLLRIAGVDWVRAGSVFQGPWGPYSAVLLGPAFCREDHSSRLMLDNGKVINFYQLWPLLPEEDAYRKLRGVQRLWDRLQNWPVSPIVAENRDCCCELEDWFDEEMAPFYLDKEDGNWLVRLSMRGMGPFYRDPGYPRDPAEWLALARRFCAQYDWTEIRLWADDQCFYAGSDNEDALRPFLLAFHDFCDNAPLVAKWMEDERT